MGKGITLCRSDIEALSESMDPSAVLDLICKLADYAEDGKEPEGLGPMEKMAFSLLKARVESVEGKQKPKTSQGSARSEAAKNAWAKRKSTELQAKPERQEQPKKEEPAKPEQYEVPTEVKALVYDSEWKKVADAYQRQIGMLPIGTALEKLISYVEDIGADAVCVAIEYTNDWQPDSPPKFLTKILNEWADQGINTEEKARASILEWKRRKERTNTEKTAKSRETQYEPPAIEGGFY